MRRILVRLAVRRGVLGGSRAWLAVGAGVVAVRVLRVAAVGKPKRVFRREITVGETILVTTRRAD